MVRFTKKREMQAAKKLSQNISLAEEIFWESFDRIIFTAARWSASMIRLKSGFLWKWGKLWRHPTQNTEYTFWKGATKQSTPLGVNLCAAMLFRSATCVQSTSFRCIWSCAAGVPPSTNVVQCSAVHQKGNSLGCSLSLRVTSMCKQHPCPHTACMEMHTLCATFCATLCATWPKGGRWAKLLFNVHKIEFWKRDQKMQCGGGVRRSAAGIDLLIERVFPANGQVTPPPPQ